MVLWTSRFIFFFTPNYQLSEQSFVCPQELEPLIEEMLKDLPGYANRVIIRSRFPSTTPTLSPYVLLAGKPNYTPLPLQVRQFETKLPDQTEQVFFTTLEREYTNQGAQDRQNYHWLFLTSVEGNRKLVMLYTQIGSTNPNIPPYRQKKQVRG